MNLFNRKAKDQPNQLTLEANGLISQPNALSVASVNTVAFEASTTPVSTNPVVAESNLTDIPAPKANAINKKFKLVVIILVTVTLGILGLLALLTVTGVDLIVMQPFLTGKVTSNGNAVANANIKVSNKSAATDAAGEYKVEGLTPGQYDVEVTAAKYSKLVERIDINRNYLSYQNSKDFELSLEGVTTAQGKITVADNAYAFIDDRIMINGQTYSLKKDGSFVIPAAPVGRFDWEFISANYVDTKASFLFKERVTNDLGELKVQPAGDLIASTVSYLTGQVVTDLQVTVEGVKPEQTTISRDGVLKIKDLEIAKQYRIDITHERYVGRRYTATSKQGESEILNFKVVEKGRVPFTRGTTNQAILFAADYDGENIVQLTPTGYTPTNEYLDIAQVYFLSGKDGVNSNTGNGKIALPNVVAVTGGTPQKVTSEATDLGQIVTNFKARKFVNLRKGTTSGSRIVEIADIDGRNRLPVYEVTSPVITNLLLADSGKAVAFVRTGKDKLAGLYWSNVENKARLLSQKSGIIATDISASGNRVLYLNSNPDTGVSDLHMYIVSEGKDVLLRSGWKGLQAQFLAESESDLLFFEPRDGTNNMYRVNLNDNKETKLTNFGSSESVEHISQQTGLIVYQTNKGLYVMNIEKALPGKLVTTNFARISAN